MPIFRLSAHVTVSAHTVVEADTLEEAIDISNQREVVLSTGHDGTNENDQWLIEDADGIPQNIHEE